MSNIRTGIGYDIHPLEAGCKLVLGGVEIPFEKGLGGWSDADVLTHAVIDALLGAAALGDIGMHFPPGEAEYKGISSLKLLEKTTALLAAAREVLYLDFESRNAVAFRFVFFCHFSFTSFATGLKEGLHAFIAADLRLLPRPDH